MGRGRGAAGRAQLAGCLLALGVAGPAGAATPGDPDGVVVGNVSELDLDRIRQLADGSDAEPGAVREAISSDSEEVFPITLQTAIEVALVNNLQLQIARATRDASAHGVPAARAKFHPTTGFGAGTEGSDLAGDSSRYSALAFLRQEVPTGGSIDLRTDFLRTDISNTTLVDQGAIEVEVRQPLMRGGRTYVARREILDAGYLFEIEDARLEAEILRVTRDAKVAYYDSILAARLIQVTAAAVERDRRLIEASEALFRAARASRRDVVSAQIRLSDDLTSLAARRAELREAQLALRDVLGLPLAELVGPAESSVPFRPISLRQGEWVERALRDRPELRELRGLLEAADLQVRVAGNDVLPQVDVLGLYRRRDDTGALANAFDLGGQDWGVGLEFAIPFANVAARERLETARQEYRRTGRDLERQRREIEREVRSQVIQLRRSLAEVSLQADKVESSRQKLEVAVARYRLGVANNLDITDAQEDLLNAETDLLTAIFDYTNGLARLEASIGGPL